MLTTERIPSRRRAVSLLFIAQVTGVAFVTIQGIFLVPLYLRFIDVSLYGAWLASAQVVGWVTILDPGTDEVTRQRVAYAHGGRQLHEIGQLIGTGFAINVVVGVCVTGAALLLTPWLPGWFRLSGPNAVHLTTAAAVLALASGATVVAYALGSSLAALQRTGGYGVVLIAGNMAGLALNVILLYAGWGLTAIAAGFLIKALVWVAGWGCVLLWTCRFKGRDPLRFSFSVYRARELVRLAGYMLASKIASMLQTSSDGVLTGIILGPSQTAVLMLTGRVIDAVRMLPDKIGAAMQPSLANLAGVGDSEKTLRVSSRFLTIISLVAAPLIATAVVLNGDVVRLWVGPALFGGQSLTALIGISSLLTILSTAVYHILFANGLIETTSKISLIAGAVKIVLLAATLRWLGLIAVPIATIAAIVIVTAPKYLRALSTALGLDRRQERRVLLSVVTGPMICVALAALLARGPSTTTWPAAALKSFVILGILAGTTWALQPVARREALGALAWGRVRAAVAARKRANPQER